MRVLDAVGEGEEREGQAGEGEGQVGDHWGRGTERRGRVEGREGEECRKLWQRNGPCGCTL